MHRSPTLESLTRVVSLVVLSLVGPLTATAPGQPGRSCVAPSGTDDTDALQTALSRCSGARGRCVVRLCAGRFRTAPLRVGDFRGTLRGAGRERTVIEALAHVQVNDDPNGYWQHDPLDASLDPWPYLLQLIGGEGEIRDLALRVPTPGPGSQPTRGWTELGNVRYEMAGALLITGRDPVSFEVRRVRIVAGEFADGEGVLQPTLFAGVSFRGLIFNPVDTSDFPVHPLSGAIALTDSDLSGMLAGASLGELGNADVLIARNRFDAFVSVDLLDASRSRVRVLRNRWDASYVGVQAWLNIDGEPSVDNLFLIASNRGTVGSFGGWGTGVFFLDPLLLPEPGRSTLGVFANDFALGTAAESAASGVEAYGAGLLRVWGNDLRGRAAAGLRIDQTTGCRIILNDLTDLETVGPTRPEGGPDIELGPQTAECLAIVRRDDVVDDFGTNNRIFRIR